jgi:hypothetical protein
MVASRVVEAVNPMESSVLALESDEIKLDMFPPGQAATSIIPIATVGVMCWFRAITSKNVTVGKPINCDTRPKIVDFGF